MSMLFLRSVFLYNAVIMSSELSFGLNEVLQQEDRQHKRSLSCVPCYLPNCRAALCLFRIECGYMVVGFTNEHFCFWLWIHEIEEDMHILVHIFVVTLICSDETGISIGGSGICWGRYFINVLEWSIRTFSQISATNEQAINRRATFNPKRVSEK